MQHPRYVLFFDYKNVGTPYTIREFAVIEDKIMDKAYASFTHFDIALKALSELSGEAVVLAHSLDGVV